MLGHFGHFPGSHRRHHAPTAGQRAASVEGSNEAASITGSRFGWAGPPVWPNAYEDVLGFAFWPDDYAARLRTRGFDVIADTISGRFDLPRTLARTATTGAAVRSDADDNGPTDRCNDDTSAQDKWPATRIEQLLQLSDTQHDALEKLQSATAQSIKTIKATCRDPGALSPSDRLRALVQTLWAVRDAGIFVREPLKTFLDTLTNAQKNSFVGHLPENGSPPVPKTASGDVNMQYQACASQNAERAERLIKDIEMKIRPNQEQSASLEKLHKVSSDMAKLLIASCAQPVPNDPLARLDAADDQLAAMNYAATTVQITFDEFYAKLDKDRKTRFGSFRR
jgi:hypothetical protein